MTAPSTLPHPAPQRRATGGAAISGGGSTVFPRKLRVLDLFSGIGGFSLGLERAKGDGEYIGFETVAFCEIEEFPRKVLAKHWPDVPCYRDVRELTGERLTADGVAGVDVITGGFPCQDISTAGKQAGLKDGTRSGLWSEIIRLASELRPRLILVENVANLLAGPSERPGGWFGRVLGDLAECGYDAEWENIPAAAVGASHPRERVWIAAYPPQERYAGKVHGWHLQESRREWEVSLPPRVLDALRGTYCAPDSYHVRDYDGFPAFMGVLSAAGNAVVPAIPELIGNAILQSLNDAGHQTPDALASARPSVSTFHSTTTSAESAA